MPTRKLYEINDRKLRRHMRIAARNGVEQPSFSIGPYTIIRWTSGTLSENNKIQHKIFLFVSKGAEHLGRISGARFRPKDKISREDVQNIRNIVEHPREAAKAAAQVSDRAICACCKRPVSGHGDTHTGIGETCRQLWGFK